VYRLAARLLKDEFCRGGMLQRLLLRYVQSLIAQVSQTAACNRHHTVEQRVSRMLLLTFDRSGSDEVAMTHESIASVLGVRREGVTEAARKLQAAHIIHYRRGHIVMINRDGLESRACECYRAARSTSDQLSGELAAAEAGSATASRDHEPARG
jgi:CRP-like cAMP-binding protein